MFLALVLAAAVPAPVSSAVAYSADGKLLAVGRHGAVEILNAESLQTERTVIGLSGRVTALAFAPNGTLAIAAGEPGRAGTVRLVPAVGKPVDFKAHNDAVYGLAFAIDGTLATAGYDRVIHLWNPADTAKPKLTLTDHSDAVYSVAFRPDGKLLASGSADRAVKVWDAATGKRLYTLGDPTDWVYSVAWSPDGKHLAAAGVDKSVRVWAADEVGGKLVAAKFAHNSPVLRVAFAGGKLFSAGEDRVAKTWDPLTLADGKSFPATADALLAFAPSPDGKRYAVGLFDGTVDVIDSATGKRVVPSKAPAAIQGWDRYPIVSETANSDSARTAAVVTLPATIAGALDRAGDADFYRITLKTGQQLGVQIVAKPGPEFVLTVCDDGGKPLAESSNGRLGFTAPADGIYAVGVRDRDYNGTGPYRLHLGEFPVVTGVFPLAVQRGKTADVHVAGVNLGSPHGKTVRVSVPATAMVGTKISVPHGVADAVGTAEITVGEFASVVAAADGAADLRTLPATVDGVVVPDGRGVVRFPAKKGERLVVETHARRLGSPLDSAIEILDATGSAVPRTTLRCTAKTFVTFRDHDSQKTGIRLDAWNEFAANDYCLAGTELLRIKALPGHPDADCDFVQVDGGRLGHLDTTPTHQALNTPLYKVEFHPPGSTFPPNGLPAFTLFFRNDDGGPGYGKDSRVLFDPPADGTYQVRVADARGTGGPGYAYRLTVRPAKPDFEAKLTNPNVRVWKDGAAAVEVKLLRLDGFTGPVELSVVGLPPGWACPPTRVEAEQFTATLPVVAGPAADSSPKLVAKAVIAGREVVHEVPFAGPKIDDNPPVAATLSVGELSLKPGTEGKFTVTVDRRGGFKGRVPVDVRGLPHGVRVQNIGLNSILITEKETSREVVLYAEPWVKATHHPFAVVARQEGRAENAAKPVLLTVKP